MTIQEAISRIDSMYPNTYKNDIKIKYLSQLDGIVKRNVIDTHEDGERVVFEGYDDKTPLDTELLVPAPYDDIYIFWLQMWVDYWDGEIDRYNSAAAMYSSAYDEFSRKYHSCHLPKKVNMKYFGSPKSATEITGG